MKLTDFCGNSKDVISAWEAETKLVVGHQILLVQQGEYPESWKPMSTVGSGVREIRHKDQHGAFRVIYVANIGDKVVVLHAFKKTTQKTAKKDIDLAAQRLRDYKGRQR